MVSTAAALEAQLTPAVDTSDMLRAALVQGVSALDHFVHEEVRTRMLANYRAATTTWHPAFANFTVSLVGVAAAAAGGDAWLDQEIRDQHGHLSFQHPDKIAAAFRIACNEPLWPAVAAQLDTDPASVRRELALIVDRRNKIAHEADYDPTPPASRYPISRDSVEDAFDLLERVARAMSSIL